MYKIKVHIKNENEFIDSNVFVDIELPAIPGIGEVLYLNEEQREILEKKAISDLSIAENYFPKWFYYGSSNYKEVEEKILENLLFQDAIFVDSVVFTANSNVIQIELDLYQK